MVLSSKAKKKLRAAAHSIKPSIIIGKEGASSSSIDSIDKILDIKELIKIKFNSYKDQKNKIINYIAEKLDAVVVGRIGNIVILFRQTPEIHKRKFYNTTM